MRSILRVHPAPRFRPQSIIFTRPIRRFSTQNGKAIPGRRSSHTLLYAVLGSGATIAAYFFWPDVSRSAPTYTNALLSPAHFTPVTVTATEPCPDPNTRLITLTVPPHSVPSLEEAAFSPVWSIYIKDDDIQVERPYTPLEGIDNEGRMKFWIKKYEKGEVGRWLHSKIVGDRIEIRGPLKTWPWQEDEWDHIIMISGGTGITPFYQLLHHTFLKPESKRSKTRFTLLHSSRTPAELPPPVMLDALVGRSGADPERLKVSLFVDSLDGPSHPSLTSSELTVGRIGQAAIERAIGLEDKSSWWRSLFYRGSQKQSKNSNDNKTLFLVCGPDPMLAAIAGPFGRNFSQGTVGGILGAMEYDRSRVWKL